MNSQFHTPSFGDTFDGDIFDLSEADTFVAQNQEQSKRLRSMDTSFDEYHSTNNESFTSVAPIISSSAVTTPSPVNKNSTATAPGVGCKPGELVEPEKPLSAYAYFFRDTVSVIKQQNPNCPFQELSRIVASMWETLEPGHKTLYCKSNEDARDAYLKDMRIYRQQLEAQQQQMSQAAPCGDLSNNQLLQSKPAVFTIARTSTDVNNLQQPAPTTSSQFPTQPPTQPTQMHFNAVTAPQQSYGYVPSADTASNNNSNNNNNNNNNNSTAPNETTSNGIEATAPQIQMITEAGSVQKCMRDNCNKRAIINPDWEDEYCSNECVVIHCHNVFSVWVQSNLDARK